MEKNPESKKGFGFWAPIAAVIGLGSYVIYKAVAKSPAAGRGEKSSNAIKITALLVKRVYAWSPLPNRDQSSWRIAYENITDKILNVQISVINATENTSFVQIFNNQNPANIQKYARTLPIPPEVGFWIYPGSAGSVIIKDTTTGELLARQDWKIDDDVWKNAQADYVQPKLL